MELHKKNFFMYVLTVLICVWYVLRVSQAFGIPFLVALITVPVISYITLKFSKVTVSTALSKKAAYKGEDVSLTVTVECMRILFPVPFIHIALLDGEERVISAARYPRSRPGALEKTYKATRWGQLKLGVKRLTIHDYIGLFSISYEEDTSFIKTACVYPAIYDPQKNDLLEFYRDIMMSDEEEKPSDMRTASESPGYEFRPYVPGDALNRISWKLLAKYDKYMVRKNEYNKNKDLALILDRRGSNELMEERMVEAVMAMLMSMVKQGIHCKVHYFARNAWQVFAAEKIDDIFSLQNQFLTYAFTKEEGEARLSLEKIDDLPVIFTCSPDNELLNIPFSSEILFVYPEELGQAGVLPGKTSWVVNDAYDFQTL